MCPSCTAITRTLPAGGGGAHLRAARTASSASSRSSGSAAIAAAAPWTPT
jgi:hypothetical protein